MHAAVLSMSGATMLHHTDARTRPVRSCAVLDPRKSRDDLIYGVLRYLSVSSVNSGVTLVPRCARGVSRFSTIIACIDKRDSPAPGSDAGSAAPACATVWQHNRRAVEVRATAQRMRSILPCALAQHAARLPSRRVLRACRGVETRAAPVPPVEAGPCLSGAQREVGGRVS